MSVGNQFALLGEKRFGPFFVAQFLGAFNDNVFKNALLLLIAFHAADRYALSSNTLINLSAGLFILPFFLFSATAGQLADKFEKSTLIRYVKLLEIAIMLCAAAAFWLNSVPVLIALLFLMGMQSSLFGPVKYGILPQILDDEELLGGNALVETGTFLAILLGTALGGILIGFDELGRLLVAAAVVGLACMGYASSLGIPRIPAADPDMQINWNSFTETLQIMRYARESRTVFLCILGISWFWFVGAIYLTQLPNFSLHYLAGDEQVVTLLLALFSIGVGAGSLLCERLSGHQIDIGLVPFGSIGLTVFGLDLALMQPLVAEGPLLNAASWLQNGSALRVVFDILLLGMFGGFYIVPLYATVQQRSSKRHRSRVIAANNVLNALLMVCASLLAITVLSSGYSIGNLFFLVAILNGVVAMFIFTQAPEFILRFCSWLLVHALYRIRVEGADNIPAKGPVVLACNHVSYVDALIIGGCVHRPVRFVMYYKYFDLPGLRWLFKTAGVIPIASAKESAAIRDAALEQIDALLRRGEVVCIFPEGVITRDGELSTFRPGVEKIVARTPAPVVPVALKGLWGSFFSRSGRGVLRHFPKPLWFRVRLRIDAPEAADSVTAEALQLRVAKLLKD
jgi:1-acyl-sn-glycerol-3-phosphate acyltransferase